MAITSSGPPTLIVLWRQGSVVNGRTVKIGGDVATTLAEFTSRCAETLASDAPSYDPDSPPEDDPQRIADRSEAFDTALMDALSLAGSHEKAKREDFGRRIICWAVIHGTGESQTIYVHKNNPVQLASKPLVAGLIDDALATMSEPLLAFDEHFDVVITPDELYILDHSDFEGLFKESDAVLALTKTWAEKITSTIPSTPGSAEALEKVLRRNGVIRKKVTSIIRRPYFDALDPKLVAKRLGEHGMKKSSYMKDGKLDFTEETIQDLVRFLNEDLFSGDFSGERFAASGKQRLGR